MEKKCSRCKLYKDVSKFYKNKSRKDGLFGYCIECKKNYTKELFNNIKIEEKNEKVCLVCKESKDISNFYKNNYSKDKKLAICNQCIRKMFVKPYECECGREIKWTINRQKHLKSEIHYKIMGQLEAKK